MYYYWNLCWHCCGTVWTIPHTYLKKIGTIGGKIDKIEHNSTYVHWVYSSVALWSQRSLTPHVSLFTGALPYTYARTWPYQPKVWTFSIIKPGLFQGPIRQKSRLCTVNSMRCGAEADRSCILGLLLCSSSVSEYHETKIKKILDIENSFWLSLFFLAIFTTYGKIEPR